MQRTPNLNKSRRSAESTNGGASLYLSFDADSTISSAAYKTMDTFNDMTSMLYGKDHGIEQDIDEQMPNFGLGLKRKTLNMTPKLTPMQQKLVSLKVKPESIFSDFKAISSTPTATNDKHVASRSVHFESDLLNAVSNDIDELKGTFVNPTDGKDVDLPVEGDKENEQPDSHSTTANTVIERKDNNFQLRAANDVFYNNDDDDDDEDKYTDIDEESVETDNTPRQLGGSETVRLRYDTKLNKPIKSSQIPGSVKSKVPVPLGQNRKSFAAVRKDIAEPDLQANRPSRIVSKSRQSMIPGVAGKNKPAAPKTRQTFSIKSKHSTGNTSNSSNSGNYAEQNYQQQTKKTKNAMKNAANANNAAPKRLLNRFASSSSTTSTMSSTSGSRPNAQRKSLAKTTLNSLATNKQNRRTMMANAASKTRKTINVVSAVGAAKTNKTVPFEADQKRLEQNIANTRTYIEKDSKLLSPRKRFTRANDDFDGIKYDADNDAAEPITGSHVQEHIKKMNVAKYECAVCHIKFSIKSLLDAHKRIHELPASKQKSATSTLLGMKKPTVETSSSSSLNSKVEYDNPQNQCKYCDKKFAIPRALHVHLMEHCSKIPHAERRRLNFTELDHVEKAQLPVFANTLLPPKSMTTRTNSIKNALRMYEMNAYASTDIKNILTGKDAANMLKQRLSIAPIVDGLTRKMPPAEPKKKPAHAGVYRTPSKNVTCHTCNMKFPTVLDYTNHCMSKHSKLADLNEDYE